ncbi:MAG: hypothetical protein ACFNUE_05035 [Bacteroides sp.]
MRVLILGTPSVQDLCITHVNVTEPLGRALALLGTAPTKNAIANFSNW